MDIRRPKNPHPAMAAARRAIARLAAGIEGPLVLAVSGGSDSMAMALAAQHYARKASRAVPCVIVDHGMRPESADEADAVARRLRELGFGQVRIETVEVAAAGAGGPEGAAREARYGALAAVAREMGGAVVLGHTADDQAETVLLGLARGSGARSIAGMAEVSALPGAADVTALRPLLALRRSELRQGLAEAGVAWVEDPMNEADGPYTTADGSPLRRSAVRQKAIPALDAALGMSVVEPLARTATLLRRDNEALDAWAEREFVRMSSARGATKDADGGAGTDGAAEAGSGARKGAPSTAEAGADCAGAESLGLPIAQLGALPAAVRTRVLRLAALAAGAEAGTLGFWHIEHLDDLVTGAGRVRGHRRLDLPGKVRARQDAGTLRFERFERA